METLKAFTLLQTPGQEAKQAEASLPTARTRARLEQLVHGTPEMFHAMDLKQFCQDLFNWDGHNRVNKPLVRQIGQMAQNAKTYATTVEFLGYLAALAPQFEADQLGSLCDLISTTATAFAPTRYTVTFNANLEQAFQGLSVEARLRMARSLWVEIHRGRWWNMTAGLAVDEAQGAGVAGARIADALKHYTGNEDSFALFWTPANQRNLQRITGAKLDQSLAAAAEKYCHDLVAGKMVNPDIAIYLSSIPWLAPNQRPESPINSLLRTLIAIRRERTFRMPRRPATICDLFPSLSLYLARSRSREFLSSPELDMLTQVEFAQGNRLSLIDSRAQLAQNAQFMGNCTLSYQDSMKQGSYALFVFQNNENVYNLAAHLVNKRWRVREMKARHNQQCPQAIRKRFQEMIDAVPAVDEEYVHLMKQQRNQNGDSIYRYQIN